MQRNATKCNEMERNGTKWNEDEMNEDIESGFDEDRKEI